MKPLSLWFGRSNCAHSMSVVDAEPAERIHDPLRVVPDLPLGHLNAAWLCFVAGATGWR